ncbi:hypothetical protein N8772_02040 [Rickettsiales bacterium]|nr:hypothetical protein [Rickettsiales bacterium]
MIFYFFNILPCKVGDMEEGNLRCDANVSVRIKDSKELGMRCYTIYQKILILPEISWQKLSLKLIGQEKTNYLAFL